MQKNTITVTGADKAISKIELVFHKQGTKAYATLSAAEGTLTSGGESTDASDLKTDVWTIDNTTTKSAVFTVGDSGQRVFKSVKVYFE